MGSVRAKLSVMMFLQYAIWGAWAVWLGGYATKTLNFTGGQIGWLFSTTALAAMVAPMFMGIVADRFMATEKLIALLHLVGSGLLLWAGFTTDFMTLFVILLIYAAFYMPTLSLTNSISFANIEDSERDFPKIRVWGTAGWIVVGLLVGFVLDPEGGVSRTPMFLAAACSAALGLFSFTLPHTPPKTAADRAKEKVDGNRAGVLSLLAKPSFLVFVLCSFLICIPLSLYYTFANAFLVQLDVPYATSLMTIGQVSELFFMATMPFFIAKLGVKRMLLVGMAAWGLRYVCFASLNFPAILFGLVLHGICYDFFFVASQVYVDTRVQADQRASAQGFISFVTLGVGLFVGSVVGGRYIVDQYPPQKIAATKVDAQGNRKATTTVLPNWDAKGESGIAKELKLQADSELEIAKIAKDYEEEAKDGSKTIYAQLDLKTFLSHKTRDSNSNQKVSREEWRVAQRNDWLWIWLWPSLGAFVTCLLFWVGFREGADNSTSDGEPGNDETDS